MRDEREEMEGFVLAGGASSRMGADKARLRLGGETLAARVARALGDVCERVRLVSSRHAEEDFGLPIVKDVYGGRGAMGGVHAALESCASRWAFVVSCDLPFATVELFRRLASLRDESADAVAPLQMDGRPQPLCALYSRRCKRVCEELMGAGELRPREMLRRVRTRWVSFAELSDLDGAEDFFRNVNTPEELEAARMRMESLRARRDVS